MDNVSFKGTVDGVRINLGGEAGIFELLNELERKIGTSKGFFGDGDCKISFGGRRLSDMDKERLEELLKRLLPMCRVNFDEEREKTVPDTDWLLAYKERNKEQETEKKPEPKVLHDEFVSVFRSNRARLYQGTLNEGTTLRSDGHLVLMGTVPVGASLIAVGNVIVIGGLYGTAHAGCNGHNGSYIMAMDMRPEGLAIARTAEEYSHEPDTDEPEVQEAEPVKKSVFDKLRKKPDELSVLEKKSENNTAPAVALLKNNKIHIDNFTPEDFTNLKNMV